MILCRIDRISRFISCAALRRTTFACVFQRNLPVLFCVLSLGWVSSVMSAGAPTKVVSTHRSPHFTLAYSRVSQENIVPDILPRIRCAFQLAGFGLTLKELPPQRAYEMLKRGLVDGDIARTHAFMLIRPDDFYRKIPQAIQQIDVWVYGRHGLQFEHLEGLKKYRLVPVFGIVYFEQYLQQGFPYVDRASSIPQALKMVRGGRGDYTFGSIMATQDIQENAWQKDIVKYPMPVDTLGLYTLMHKTHAAHIPALDAAYRRVVAGEHCETSIESKIVN